MVGLPRVNSNILVKFCIKLGNTASFFLGGGGGCWMPVHSSLPTSGSSPVCAKKATERSLRDILVGVRKRRRVTKGGKSIAPVQLRRFHHLGFVLYFLPLLFRHPPKLHSWKCNTTQYITGTDTLLTPSFSAIITIPVTEYSRTIVVATARFVT